MDKRLQNNINTEYWGAAQHLYSRHARRKIIAYVESYEDVAFWHGILNKLENETRTFQIMLPNADALSKGKKMALMSVFRNISFGSNMIACVDSDYDYLMQHASIFSHRMNSDPYIFQTYTYAIENYHCYAESLQGVCTDATLNDRRIIDFSLFLKTYSEIIYPLFLWNVFFYREHREKEFSITDFNDCVGLGEVDLNNIDGVFNTVRAKVNDKLQYLRYNYQMLIQKVSDLVDDLSQLGVRPDNTYLFVQGHYLMNAVVMKLLIPVCTQLRRERENEIKRLARTEEQFNNELQAYHNSICPLDIVIHRNMNFYDLFLYKKLLNQLDEKL